PLYQPITSALYTITLHDALPICSSPLELIEARAGVFQAAAARALAAELIVQNLAQDLAQAYGKPVNIFDLNHQPQAMSQSDGAADRKSTRLNSSHVAISYAVFCL